MGRRIGFGILLMVVGFVLLFLQVGGFAWDWGRHWPLIVVLLGLLDLIENGWRGLRGGGGLLILVGSFLLLFTMQLAPWPLRQAWPAGLILLGLLSLLGDAPSLPWAILLIGGGAFLLAVTTGTLRGDWRQFWPVILILAGLAALIGREDTRRHEPRVPPAPPSAPPPVDRLEILRQIRAGEISAEEGAAILERLSKEHGSGKD